MPWMCWRSPRAHLSEPMAQVKSFLCPCSGQPRWLRPAAAAYPTSDSTKAGSRHPQKSNTRAVTHTPPPPPTPHRSWFCGGLIYLCGVNASRLRGPSLLSRVSWDAAPRLGLSSLPFSRPHCPFLNCMAGGVPTPRRERMETSPMAGSQPRYHPAP